MDSPLMRVTIEFEWNGPGKDRPYSKIRYDFPYPELPKARFTTSPHPLRASYDLFVHNPIVRPVITETITETECAEHPGETGDH